MWFPSESSAKKNVFTQKYDEIRSFDGTAHSVECPWEAMFAILDSPSPQKTSYIS
jgi:hypothetical protein